jgi:thiol-disulfide isomerase/thioredoxin
MTWEFDVRSLIGALLLGLAACDAAPPADTQKAEGPQGAAPAAATPPAAAAAPKSAAAKIDRSQAGAAAPTAAFVDRAEKPTTLAAFKGTPVLVNLWATWCAPCLAEMPALDRLAAREKGKLVILPISQDMEGWRAVDKFFAPGKFAALTPYLDQPTEWALAVGAKGLPVSILYDAQGKEVWRVNGPLEWDQPEVAALLK